LVQTISICFINIIDDYLSGHESNRNIIACSEEINADAKSIAVLFNGGERGGVISGPPEETKSVPAEDIGSEDGASVPVRTISFGLLAVEEFYTMSLHKRYIPLMAV